MEKDVLISVIINNIKEVETLVNSFKRTGAIMPSITKLTLEKLNHIKDEIEILTSLNNEIPSLIIEKQAETVEKIKTPFAAEATIINVEKIEIKNDEIASSKSLLFEKQDIILIEEKTEIEPQPKTEESISSLNQIVQTVTLSSTEKTTNTLIAAASKSPSVLGETIGDKRILSDKLVGDGESTNQRMIGKPVDDIKKAIGINDRFLFQRELFEGNAQRMNQTIEELNQLNTFENAKAFIAANFSWEYGNETAETFINAVHRRFL